MQGFTPNIGRLVISISRSAVPMRFLAILVVFSSAGASTGPPTAAAQTGPIGLEWVVPPGSACGLREEMVIAIARRFDRVLIVEPTDDASPVIQVHISGSAVGRWTATVSVRGTRGTVLGERRLESERTDCRSLDQPLEVVLLLVVDSILAPEAPAPVPEPAPIESLPPATASEPPIGPVPQPTDLGELGRPWRFGGGVVAGARGGALPWVSPGVGLVGAMEPSQFLRLEASAMVWVGTEEVRRDHGVDLLVVAGNVELCPRLISMDDAGGLGACVGAALDLFFADGFGFSETQQRLELAAGPTAGLRYEIGIGPSLRVDVGVTLGALIVRPRFVFVDPGGVETDVFLPSWLSVTGLMSFRLETES